MKSLYDRYCYDWKYDGVTYTRTISEHKKLSNNPYTTTNYYADGSVCNESGYICTRSGSVEWKLNGQKYTGTRYRRDNYTGTTSYSENDDRIKARPGYFYDDHGYVDLDPTYETKKENYYWDTDKAVEYESDDVLKLISATPHEVPGEGFKATDATEYFVSYNTGTDYDLGSASSQTYVKLKDYSGTNNPFEGAYTQAVEEKKFGLKWINKDCTKNFVSYNTTTTTYEDTVAFYYHINARYGADISSQWPDVEKFENVWGTDDFTGTVKVDGKSIFTIGSSITQTGSKFRIDNPGGSNPPTIKGRYATMSEELIVVNNKATTDNGHVADKAHAAQILQPRYRHDQYRYVYRIYFGTGGRNPSAPAYDMTNPDDAIRVYSGGPYQNQTQIAYDGYTCVYQNPNNDQKSSSNNWTGNDVFIDYKYEPEDYYIHFFVKKNSKFEEVNTDPNNSSKTKDRYYYKSDLSVADHPSDTEDYRPKASDIPDGYKFYGWYTNPLGEGKAFDLTKDRMPNGDLFLYAIVNPKPNQLHFTLPAYEGKQPVWKGTNDSATRTVGTADSALEAGQTDDKIPYNWSFERYAESEHNTGNYSWSYFTPDDIKDSAGNTLYTFGGWAMGSGTSEREFFETQRITGTWTLHPIWKPVEVTEATVTVRYIDAEGNTIYPSENVPVTLNQPKLFKAIAKTGYTVTPSFEYANIDSAWLENHKKNDGSYVLDFIYSEAGASWTYSVEYYLLLKEDGGTREKGFLLKTESDVPASGEYAFKAFYSLPDYPNYEVARLEVYEGESTTAKATTTQPGIQLQKGTDVILKVYIVPNAIAFNNQSYSATYNGAAQGIKDQVTGLPTLPALSGDITFDETVYDYYLGTQKLSGEPTNAGIYRVQIKITLTDDSGTYIFWRSPAYQSSSKPGVLFTIRRCDVLLISRDVDYVFLNTEDNRTALAGNSKVRLDSVARYQTGDGNLLTYGAEVPAAIKALLDGDTAGAMKNLTISLSADAFRSIPTKEEGDRTSNAFTCQVKNLDQNNFNIYKQYGYIYFWESLDDYKEVTGNQTVTGHD